MTTQTADTVTYPGARRPDRSYIVDAHGLGIATYEWGDEKAPPVMLVHGGFDFAGTFDVFAPMLADAGWRPVAWDHRGHGDSEHAEMYSWDADARDAVAVMDRVGRAAMPVIGHSKGGAMMLQVAEALPHRFSAMVNIDGLPSPRRHPDVAGHERTRMLLTELSNWLDDQRQPVGERRPGSIDELAERRGRQNPRLSMEWLRYLVTIGARHDTDGWRWKIDPALRRGGFGPHRNSWSMERLPGLTSPLLGIVGTVPEPMGWGNDPDGLRPYLPPGGRLEVFDDTGHFVHIEHPRAVADLVLDFLGSVR